MAELTTARRRVIGTVGVVALAVAGLGIGAAPASARPAPVDRTDTYVVHGIPGVPVDVYLNDALALPNFQPLKVAGPVSLLAGSSQNVEIFAAGADPAGTPVIAAPVTVPGGRTAASIVAHLDAEGDPTASVFVESQRYLPGTGRLAVRHAAALGAVDVYIGRVHSTLPLVKLAGGVTNGGSADLLLRPGKYRVVVVPAGASPSTPALSATVKVTTKTTFIAYAIGDPTASTLGLVTERTKKVG